MITDWNRSKTCLMATEASRQHSCITGSRSVGVRSSAGSRSTEKPDSKVAHMVPNSATSMRGWSSCTLVISSVRSRDRRRSEANLRGFLSMAASTSRPARKRWGFSTETSPERAHCSRRPFTWRTRRCRKVTKCSARRMLPGTASLSMPSGSTGLARISSASAARPPPGSAPAAARPDTSWRYSRLSRSASTRLSLAISAWRRPTLRSQAARVASRKLMDMTSMHTLSMLWASSKTTTHSRWRRREMRPAILGSRRYW
mmetsp:Transcript_6583/g.22558  ORF Transcript_6583/g.22558 Transcript_6583/m.22558 type:complete len:258 (+) Transcript_6583:868-1641(+)